MVNNLLFALQRQIQIVLCNFLRFFDEAMQQNHLIIIYEEYDSRDAIAMKLAAHFPQSITEGSAIWPPDWPTELDLLNILAENPPILLRQIEKKLANRFSASAVLKKPCR